MTLENCMKIKNLLSYDFEQGTMEFICKEIGAKSTKMIFFVKVEINIPISSSTGRHVRPTKMIVI